MFRRVTLVVWLFTGFAPAGPRAQQQAQPASGQAALIARAESLVDALAARDFAKVFAQFNAGLKQNLPVEKLTTGWDSVLAQAGGFTKRIGSRSEARAPHTLVLVSCDFARARAEIGFTFDAAGEIAELVIRPVQPAVVYTAPDYATAGSYTEQEVTVGAANWPLPGTLTMPAGAGPFAAVVFVHGSGPNDRDESFGPNKPFKDLALGLGSRGVAVLRYDKRTKIHAPKLAAAGPFTVKEETVDDALAAVAFLRKQPRIDPARIYVLGHSLGGTVAPRIGAADPALAGLIVLAGAVRPIDRAIVEQIQYLADADGTITDAEQRVLDESKKLAEAVSKLTPADAASTANLGGAPPSYWLDLRDYDPTKQAATLKHRMLILQGARDYQVTVPEFDQWKAALAGRAGAEFHLYPALNHLFLPGQGKSLPAEYMVPGHVPREVIADIAAWIK